MIGLDTNVLVRFLVEDDPRQSAAAAALIDRVASRDETLFVSDVALCETVWVLAGSYRLPRVEIATTLRDLLRSRHLAFSSSEKLARALDAFARGRGDFAGYLIREDSLAAGCDVVATFDRELLKEQGFVSPGSSRLA